LAEQTGLYLDLTGLGCYHKQDVPQWYDKLTEQDRWAAQAVFWETVAKTCAHSPAIFCYDLLSESRKPVVVFWRNCLAVAGILSGCSLRFIATMVATFIFIATFHGRAFPKEKLDPGEVNGLGILLGDKKAGPFKAEVDWIKVTKAE
jgi:hypothetical protein